MNYYEIHEKHGKSINVELYDDCLNFNHEIKTAYCPLCQRAVEGSLWLGPYKYYIKTQKRSHFLFPLAITYFLISKDFYECFQQEGLTGISSVKKCEIYYQKQLIQEEYVIPNIQYSNKAIAYARDLNNERQQNKKLPRCSLCMNPNSEKNDLYFSDVREYDIFHIYDSPGVVYCNDRFRGLCEKMGVNNVEFRAIKA